LLGLFHSKLNTMDCCKLRLMLLIAFTASVNALPLDEVSSSAASSAAEGGGIEFPNTAFIPGDLTEQLNVDDFFSLWLFFLDDDVTTSDQNFTILAPRNGAAMKPSPIRPSDKERVRELVLKHIILGHAVTTSTLTQTLTLMTLGGTQIRFKPQKDAVTANGVKVVQKEVHVPHGVIVVLEDFLFMEQYNGPPDEDSMTPIPMITSADSDFPMIELGTHNLHDNEAHAGRELVKPEMIGFALDRNRNRDLNVSKPFYDDLVDVLNFLRSGTSDFLNYVQQVNISTYFQPDGEYTAFIPMDDSFAQWYPIDWGFNPFLVEEFVLETIRNHFVAGTHPQKSLRQGTVLTTIGGKKLKFSNSAEKLKVNGVDVFEGDTAVSRGNIQFIGDLLFVEWESVSELNKKHRDVESAPLVAHPWYWSQFLSHVYRELNSRDPNQFTLILDYLSRSQLQLRDQLPGSTEDFTTIRYSMFVPTDAAFMKVMVADAADPFTIDDEFRNDVLLNHFVRRRIYDVDLVDNQTLTMANNQTVTIKRTANVTKVDDAVIEETDVFIYNLGNIFIIDDVLSVSHQRVRQVLAKNVGKTPAPSLPDDEETATVVIDVVAELEERLAAEEDTTVLP